jgi:exosome complex component CSL4
VPPLKDDSALVRIVAIRGKKKLNGNFTGVLHVSQVAKSYVNIIHDAVNLGDRVLAKVVTSWPPYQLSTADDDLGVIYSTCTRCGEELVMRRGGLFCRRDKLYERKKVSRSYLIKEA